MLEPKLYHQMNIVQILDISNWFGLGLNPNHTPNFYPYSYTRKIPSRMRKNKINGKERNKEKENKSYYFLPFNNQQSSS